MELFTANLYNKLHTACILLDICNKFTFEIGAIKGTFESKIIIIDLRALSPDKNILALIYKECINRC